MMLSGEEEEEVDATWLVVTQAVADAIAAVCAERSQWSRLLCEPAPAAAADDDDDERREAKYAAATQTVRQRILATHSTRMVIMSAVY